MLRLVVNSPELLQANLTICLFQSFKERVLFSIKTTKRPDGQRFLSTFVSLSCDWECKGKKTFSTCKLFEKNFFVAVYPSSFLPIPCRFGSAKVRTFSGDAREG
jgi:hypothetical protein